MDSRGPSHQHQHQHHQHHHQPPHHHHQPPQGMMLHHHHHHQQHHHNNQQYSTPPPQPPPQMIVTPNNRFPFTSPPQVIPPPTTAATTTPPSQPKGVPTETLSSPFSGDGSRQSGFRIDPNSQKKKRGRPRKYSPDSGGNNIALGLTPTPLSPPGSGGGGGGGGQEDSGGVPSSEKRHRGRPPGSSKKQLDALGNCGVGFTPHVILVNAGEDIAQKIVAFSKQGPRTVCVLSANGSICNVSLRQPAHNGGVVNYEGRFELISLSGSFLFSENNGGQVRTGDLSVSLAGSDGRVLGGGVAGVLMAASPVQIIVGSFIANGKKTKYMPSVPQSHALNFASPPPLPLPAPESPPSQDVSSEGSEENGSNHIDRSMGSYANSNHSMHNMHMYNPMGWPNPTS